MRKLVKFKGKIDTKQFCEILEDSLMESFETLGIEEEEYYAQQDNESMFSCTTNFQFSRNNIFVPVAVPSELEFSSVCDACT